MKEISKAILEAQKEMSNAVKGAKNPYFKSTYADLNAVREAVIPALNKHGITVLQPMETHEGKNFVKTMLLHESGEFICSMTEIVFQQGNPQAQGSGITYARRYGLQSIVCIGADDDDGEKAMSRADNKTPKPILKQGTEAFVNSVKALQNGYKIEQIEGKYQMDEDTRMALISSAI